MLGHAPAAVYLLAVKRAGTLGEIAFMLLHRRERPGEVHGRRPRGGERRGGRSAILALGGREGVAVRRRDADRGSPAHGERADCLGDLAGAAADEIDLLLRQPPLIEENDAVVLQARDSLRA